MEYINKTIGKYAITRKIGEGGMASVYEGIHEKLGTKVAFKVLSPLLARDPQLRQRFENEANFMASLNHPNITRVLDIEEQDETLVIVMELIEGEGLDDRVKRTGPLSNTEVKVIFTQVLNAFEYAHSKGIVHRDIKPANIFIDKYNQVKILDFGIAKIFGLGNEMTQTGTQMGTPVYMSPEQVRGEKSIDHRSDIYSLGITLYFLLSGKAPYESTEDSSFEIFTKIVNEPIPHLSNNSFYDAIIQKAVSKDRNDRYQMIDEMQKTLYDSGLYTKEGSQEEVPRIPSAAAITSSAPWPIFIPAPRAYRAYIYQFLFGLGFKELKLRRIRSYFYLVLIAFSWFSFLNIFLVDHGRGPFGGISFLYNLYEFHNYGFGGITIILGWFIGHFIGTVDLAITHRKNTVANKT